MTESRIRKVNHAKLPNVHRDRREKAAPPSFSEVRGGSMAILVK